MKFPSWEDKLGPLFFCWRPLSLCNSSLSTEIPSSPCLLACQILDLKLDGFYVLYKACSPWLDEVVPVITGSLPIQLVLVFSQSDSPGMESRVLNTQCSYKTPLNP